MHGCTTRPDDCISTLYCTPSILGERHCCPDGNIWKYDTVEERWKYMESIDCTPNILDCIRSTKGIKNCIFNEKTCCKVQLGTKLGKEWISKIDCIKAY